MYKYRSVVVEVVDGDTVWLRCDQGFGGAQTERLRLIGINAPELRNPGGHEAQEYLTQLLAKYEYVFCQTFKNSLFKEKTDKYGRYVAMLWPWAGSEEASMQQESINFNLVTSGHASLRPEWPAEYPRPEPPTQ